MKLRELKSKDAFRMLEWMHDPIIVENLHVDFLKKNIDDCFKFINNSNNNNMHYAIVDNNDIYMGTVSLKHITNINAEFAIVLHRDAIGKGYSIWSMNKILEIGFCYYKLQEIYWCVDKDNVRALRFYDKNGFALNG